SGVQLNRQAGDPGEYLDLLSRQGLVVDAWETTYLHVLQGPDPVTEWYKGTGLRPVLAELDPADAGEFLAEYSRRVQQYYPAAPSGTVLPFGRVFVVAHRPYLPVPAWLIALPQQLQGLGGQPRLGIELTHSVPRQVHQVRGHLLEPGLAGIQPPLARRGD